MLIVTIIECNYGKGNLWQTYNSKCYLWQTYNGKCINGKNIMPNVTEPIVPVMNTGRM